MRPRPRGERAGLFVPQRSAQLRPACPRSALTRVGVCARTIPASALCQNRVQFAGVSVANREISESQDGLLLFILCHFVSLSLWWCVAVIPV